MTDLFIGVVSHAKSRFSVSQGPAGLGSQLHSRLAASGLAVALQVNTADLHDPSAMPVSRASVQASLTEQLHVDRRWSAYLSASRGPSWWLHHGLRWARRAEQAIKSPPVRSVERLLNIELSHLDLLRTGTAAGADWVLVLEDDAACVDVDDCATGILGLMDHGRLQPAFVNVSQSFTPEQLGIAHLLAPAQGVAWRGSVDRRVLAASRPVTNTVCAILYRSTFASALLAVWDALPVEPVVPIDWKMNVALMQMFEDGTIASGDCWLVDPGPIDQMSMRAEVSA